MSELQYQAEQCNGCGLCLNLCPNDLIHPGQNLNDRGALPVTVTSEYCIHCSHCVEICPESAFSLPEDSGFNLAGWAYRLSYWWHKKT